MRSSSLHKSPCTWGLEEFESSGILLYPGPRGIQVITNPLVLRLLKSSSPDESFCTSVAEDFKSPQILLYSRTGGVEVLRSPPVFKSLRGSSLHKPYCTHIFEGFNSLQSSQWVNKEEFDKLCNESRGYAECFVVKEELSALQDRMGRAEANFVPEHDVEEPSRSAERRANTSAEALKHLLMTKIDADTAI